MRSDYASTPPVSVCTYSLATRTVFPTNDQLLFLVDFNLHADDNADHFYSLRPTLSIPLPLNLFHETRMLLLQRKTIKKSKKSPRTCRLRKYFLAIFSLSSRFPVSSRFPRFSNSPVFEYSDYKRFRSKFCSLTRRKKRREQKGERERESDSYCTQS